MHVGYFWEKMWFTVILNFKNLFLRDLSENQKHFSFSTHTRFNIFFFLSYGIIPTVRTASGVRRVKHTHREIDADRPPVS